jgi:hypothetical protein
MGAEKTLYRKWREQYDRTACRLIEVNTIAYPLNAIATDTELFTLPNFNSDTMMLRFRFNILVTDDTVALLQFVTNLVARLFDVRIYSAEGKMQMNLGGNGGADVIAGVHNFLIAPGDIRLFAEPFVEDAMQINDELSSMSTDGAGTQRAAHCDVLIPYYLPAGEAPIKYQLTWRRSLQTAVGTGGDIFSAASLANLAAVDANVEVLVELVDGAEMEKFAVKNAQTINCVVGDSFLDSRLNVGEYLEALVMQSPAPANVGDIILKNGDTEFYNTEFEDILAQCKGKYPIPMYKMNNDKWDLGLAAPALIGLMNGEYNTLIMTPPRFQITTSTSFRVTVANAAQNVRLMQIVTGEVGRLATRPEVISTAPAQPIARAAPRVAPTTTLPSATPQRRGLLGLFRG